MEVPEVKTDSSIGAVATLLCTCVPVPPTFAAHANVHCAACSCASQVAPAMEAHLRKAKLGHLCP